MPPLGERSNLEMVERMCRCETTIPAAILDGFACGNPDCWRTAEAKASFEAFVADLKRKRGETTPAPPESPAP